ncbi:hypothetical protein HXX76_002741 [Chlamydomonas incerta]|uniref:Uncharacterized protein n=1 Tax=Chlamydomonas incerta TaxID=51695 RepID=A0A835TBY6_CHLIN|nr:hypothetical protein HXX76_002741 [Chlamydomonas incerta]|eukprot:KAG2442657.1 hypothetical protein HXX76_002741 [Chlamydomonas incerta]
MWGQPPDRGGFSPSFILGLVLIMFLLTADMSAWGNGNNGNPQQLRLGQQAQQQAQEVREKLLYELTLSNERLEKENRHLHQQLLVLRRLLRTCRGGAAGNRTLTPSELAQLAQVEIDLASGKTSAAAAGAGVGAAAGAAAVAGGAAAAAGAGAGTTQGSAAGAGVSGTGTGAGVGEHPDHGATQKQAAGGIGGR